MKRSAVALTSLALLVASLSVAMAQGGPGGGGGGRGFGRQGGMMGGMMGGGIQLLRMPAVQQELKMTQPQIEKIQPASQALMEAMRELFQGGQDMSQEERMKAGEKVQAAQTKAVADILDTTQLKRFKQLELQRMGSQAVARPDVTKELGITDDQKTKMREAQRANMEKMREMFQGQNFQQMTPEERQAMGEKMTKMRAESDAAALAVLTPAQQKTWKDMLGVPFKFPANQMGMGGRGNRGNRGAGGGGGGQPPL